MKIELQRSTCEGTGFCVAVAPDVFVLDDDVARVLDAEVTEEALDRVEEAETLCPTQSIRITFGQES